MKKLFLILGVLGAWTLGAQSKPTLTPGTQISQVMVFADRAMVERRAQVDLPAGGALVIFDNLPDRVDPNSLQVRGQGNGILEDIQFQVKYTAEIPDEKIKALNTNREDKEKKIRALTDGISRSQGEKSVLNKVIDKVTAVKENAPAELSPEKWMAMMKFYADRLGALDESIRSSEYEIQNLRNEVQALKNQLSELQGGRQKKKNQAMVVLGAEKPGTGILYLSYMVQGPSWAPVYDLRVDSQKNQMELGYYANLIQATGEDWTDVPLKLSTARVEVGGRQPVLEPWNLSLYDFNQNRRQDSAKMERARGEMQMYNVMPAPSTTALRGGVEEDTPAELEVREALAQVGGTAVVFAVQGKNTIASDNIRHRVFITNKSWPAVFRYSATPKLSTYAYLKTKVKNASDFPLLPGKSKVFLDGNFVSEASLDFVAPGEEFWTFLGIDESIKVEYRQVKRQQSEEGLIGKSTRITYEYETIVTNNRKSASEVVVWDQLPITPDKRITVKLLEPNLENSPVSVKKDTSERLEWLLNLNPGEKKKFNFSFYVEYPVELSVSGLR